jgi:hypothetical protein
MLVVSAQGLIHFYNQIFAQLHGIPPGAFLGQPVEGLDRRQRLRDFLRSGCLSPERLVPRERRRNREIILPLWEADHSLAGAIVLIGHSNGWLRGMPRSSLPQVEASPVKESLVDPAPSQTQALAF